jgi:signal transduction protein with GAF and PtsI domain
MHGIAAGSIKLAKSAVEHERDVSLFEPQVTIDSEARSSERSAGRPDERRSARNEGCRTAEGRRVRMVANAGLRGLLRQQD